MNALEPRTYVINFFANDTDDLRHMTNFVKGHPMALAYWNYIPFIYCIKSHATATEVSFAIAEFLPKGNFIVAEVNLQNINGRLPQSAWEWFYSPTPATPPPNVLADAMKRYRS